MQQPELGLKITELRKQKGFTQEELVEQCNINVRTLQRIESGEVSPRSYTIKTILSALDYDYESLQEIDQDRNSELGFIPPKEAKSIYNSLTIAWISGILFLIIAVFEGVGDFIRISSKMEEGYLIYGKWGHFLIKLLVLIFNGILLYGFLIVGKLLKNYLMKITVVLMLIALVSFYAYDIVSLFNSSLDIEVVFLAESVAFGALGILFGISILKSRSILGTTGLVSGVAELVLAGCLLSILLSPIALFLFFPALILEILVLYKISTMVKNRLS